MLRYSINCQEIGVGCVIERINSIRRKCRCGVVRILCCGPLTSAVTVLHPLGCIHWFCIDQMALTDWTGWVAYIRHRTPTGTFRLKRMDSIASTGLYRPNSIYWTALSCRCCRAGIVQVVCSVLLPPHYTLGQTTYDFEIEGLRGEAAME